jgi:tetratricopeptide (TPR) repeat protein
MTRSVPNALYLTLVAAALAISPAAAQTEPKPAETKAAATDKGSAYYNFSMGHLYAELAGAYGNRGEYLNKAIDFYKQALKADPSATFLSEELTDLYIQSGQLNRAVTEAEDLLRQNPNNLDARRVLGRIYTRLIGDAQQNKIDEKMLAKAIEQYKFIVAKDAKDQDSQLVLAKLYRLAHNSVEAEKAYKAVLANEPDNDEALTGLALVYSDVGDTKGAIEMLRRASDKDPNPRTLGALAGFYEQSQDYANAAETWKKLLPLVGESNSNRVKHQLAQDLLYSDKVDEALTLYKEIAAEDPRDPQIQLRLAEIYRQKHDFAAARAVFEKAKQADGANLEVRYEEVNLLDAEGKTDNAIAVLNTIVESTAKKDYTEADKATRGRLLERLGMLYRSAGKYPESLAALHQIFDLDPDPSARETALRQLVETYRVSKNMPGALREVDAALKKYPKDRNIALVHASVLADMGKVDQAASELRAQMNGKKDRDMLLTIAQVYEKGKKFTEEQKALDEAQGLSTTPQEKQGVMFQRGAMFERMKNFDSAEAEFRKVLSSDPDNAGALNYLGYMLADRDVRLDEAQKMISRALELDPENGAYLDSLGWVLYRQNRLDQAEDNLRKALELIKEDPTVHDHLGDVYLKEGKVREAITQWQTSLKEWEKTPSSDADPQDIAKVTKKLEGARVRVAKETKQ